MLSFENKPKPIQTLTTFGVTIVSKLCSTFSKLNKRLLPTLDLAIALHSFVVKIAESDRTLISRLRRMKPQIDRM
jgi:hypothetical protein